MQVVQHGGRKAPGHLPFISGARFSHKQQRSGRKSSKSISRSVGGICQTGKWSFACESALSAYFPILQVENTVNNRKSPIFLEEQRMRKAAERQRDELQRQRDEAKHQRDNAVHRLDDANSQVAEKDEVMRQVQAEAEIKDEVIRRLKEELESAKAGW